MAMNDLGWAAEGIRAEATAVSGLLHDTISQVRDAALRPTTLMRPAVYPDGDQWCALYGENIQQGVAGFGDTPEAACKDFDAHWLRGTHAHYAHDGHAEE